ncbi:MAG: RNA polymerase sigma factor [Pseudoflavonifractor sp.]|nr:RNA polymerase sigma factor [Alloprevotella sp.]MCM1117214.1 RNA polymerase sigma factor [Pseudoflavonifractor sp.]
MEQTSSYTSPSSPAAGLARRFEELRPKLKLWASRILGSSDDADDALQEAFFRLWRRRDTPGNVDAMSHTAVRSACIDLLRRRAVRRAEPLDAAGELLTLGSDADDSLAAMVQEVTDLIESRLDSRAREILLLHDSQGYDYDEISLKMGITEVNCRAILSRARKTIRDIYRSRQTSSNNPQSPRR